MTNKERQLQKFMRERKSGGMAANQCAKNSLKAKSQKILKKPIFTAVLRYSIAGALAANVFISAFPVTLAVSSVIDSPRANPKVVFFNEISSYYAAPIKSFYDLTNIRVAHGVATIIGIMLLGHKPLVERRSARYNLQKAQRRFTLNSVDARSKTFEWRP